MKQVRYLLVSPVIAGVLALHTSIQAAVENGEVVPGPSAYLEVTTGDSKKTFPIEVFRQDDGESKKVRWGFEFNVGSEQDGFSANGGGTLDPDPSIAYGLAVTDFGAPSTFGFFFSTPIVPTGPSTLVDASIVGGMTDLTGNGVSITPTGATVQTSSVLAPSTVMGVDLGPAQAHPAGPPGSFYGYGAYASAPILGPPGGPWTSLSVGVAFGLSGGGDIAALTGFAQVVDAPASVPDSGPGTIGIAALALVLVGGLLGQRRSE